MYKTRFDNNKRTYICRKKGEWIKHDDEIEEYYEDVALVYKTGVPDHDRIVRVIVDALNAAEQNVQTDGAYRCPKCGDFLGEGGWCPQHGLPASPRR